MAINIRNEKVERLARELAHMTGESTTETILHALEERKERMTMKTTQSEKRTMPEVLDFLEKQVWAHIPPERLGRRPTKKERERILGYGKGGV